MIPKIIHYCWLSDDVYPEKIAYCINSWKKKLPDYKFVKWDFSRIDKSKFKWISDAFDNKRYAYAADYVRVYALFHYGGIYLDSDVEVLKTFDDLLDKPYFFCSEYEGDGIEAACMGAEKEHPMFKYLLDYYNERSFIKEDGTFNEVTIPSLMKKISNDYFDIIHINSPDQIDKDLSKLDILPPDYFSPKSLRNGKLHLTDRTYAIHHFSGSWMPVYYRIEQRLWHFLGIRDFKLMLRVRNLFKYGTIKSKL